MKADEVEKMWSQAVEEAQAAGEPNARHRFAAIVRSATKEEDARICDGLWDSDYCADAIRASK